jgi:hypothetical protein
MNKTVINLTPHDIHVYVNDKKVQTYPAHYTSEEQHLIPRCSMEAIQVEILDDLFPLYKTIYGSATNLPDQRDDTLFIVSAMVRNTHSDRRDLISPYGLVRDDKQQIIGCTGFDTNIT